MVGPVQDRVARRQFLTLLVVAGGCLRSARAEPKAVSFPEQLAVRERQPFPNSRLPVLLYRAPFAGAQQAPAKPPPHEHVPGTEGARSHSGALRAGQPAAGARLAAAFESRFRRNAWHGSWRGGLYKFHHYHSTAHEALGVFRGQVSVRLGGPGGLLVALSAGDVLVLPAGVSHKNERQSAGFRVLGAYPEGTTWDMQYGKPGERPKADARIGQVPLPKADPLFGPDGPLPTAWASALAPAAGRERG